MKREELQKMKADELRAICRENGIVHYHGKDRFRKDELIEAILEYYKNNPVGSDGHEEGVEEDKRVDMEKKMPYIEDAKIGTLVAFTLPNGRVKSAKIVKKSTPKRRFMVETGYGAQYIVPYEDIVWVRSGRRWPKGVYRLLKGLVGIDGEET